MDVLDVPVYMRLCTQTTLFFLQGSSDLKVFDMFFSQGILAHSVPHTGCNVNYIPRTPACCTLTLVATQHPAPELQQGLRVTLLLARIE